MTEERKADYSIASPEERENVAAILKENCSHIIAEKKTSNPQKFQARVDAFVKRILAGDVITGKDFENLVMIFRKQSF